ncbi:uncharacterized protein FIBRA_04392 [Fibroporia radiculosa]|uniref:Aldehyde dehydrogenase n=1 Tax=Fibroporia radiculosa TaxID=599839 RepID=J4HWI1_9APHY|nr:uncharacterized protein FIBRA_04392 [Fibroporia radiculosa]CCM02302.1 predicted protein [Fibroporia radiculosa]
MSDLNALYTPLEKIPQVHEGLKKAFRSGKTRPIAFRKTQLLKLCHLVQDNLQRFKDALLADLGRPANETDFLELNGVLIEVKKAYDNVEKWASTEKPPFSLFWFSMSPHIRKEPKGVVLLISPFNYPVYLLLCPLAAAIAAGNAVLLKPSELCTTVAALLTELLPKYLDTEVYEIVNGGVEETTKILELPFNHILYTGNGNVGRIVATAAAKHLTPVTLELGGKSPCVIDPDCDVKVAAKRIMWGRLVNSGQLCISPDYVLVPKDFQDTFVEALKQAYEELHPTDPLKSGMLSRIVNERHVLRLKRLLDNTKGTVVFGNKVELSEREIFGPILPVVPVKDVDAAIEFINERDNPLVLYVFTRNRDFKKKVLNNTLSGTASINEVIMGCQAEGLPFGGVGASGYGYTTGQAAFNTFTHMRSTVENPTWADSLLLHARYTPYKSAPLRRLTWMLRPSIPPLPKD